MIILSIIYRIIALVQRVCHRFRGQNEPWIDANTTQCVFSMDKMTYDGSVNWCGWVGALSLMAILPISVSLTPWASEPLRYVLMEAFHTFCHQIPERSPHVNGVQLAVCDRCYGILIGLFSGPIMALFYWKWIARHARMMILFSILPLMMDWGFGMMGVLSNTPGSRFVTGSLFGIVAGGLVAHGIAFRKNDQH